MSIYGSEIIDRLSVDCGLRNPLNPIGKLIDYGIGEWFDGFVESNDYDNFFLDSAVGGYLDKWGRDYNVPRKPDEDDESYRKRLYYEVLGYLTVSYLLIVYGLTLYSYQADFDVSDNTMVSDNPYLNSYGFMTVASDDIQSVLAKKFVVDTGLTFIEVE